MRVAIFVDGKNFYAGWKDQSHGRDVDFRKLSQWIVRTAGGDHLMGAYYYTGIDTALPTTASQERLDAFLGMLEVQPGFFVQRFVQRNRTHTCAHCGTPNTFSQEKEVDTTIVADMLRLAASGGFDIAVLLSGDADLVPAVEGVRALGKQVFVASWGSSGLSARIRRAAFDHIDLLVGLPEFERQGGFHSSPTTSA
ncbi:MAG: NYN domain-containing protein, partial [Planctomycetes bacterium]|nr:NYN domain-containing protein [Planctomycetota bacterium]